MRSKKSSLANENLLFLGEMEPGVKPGSENIRCGKGKAAIEMAPVQEKYGMIYIPETIGIETRADVGRVISSGIEEVEPGKVVLVAYGHGKRVRGFSCEGFKAEGLMVFTGIAGGAMLDDDEYGEPNQAPVEIDWDETILAHKELDWEPYGSQIELEVKRVETEGSFYLPGVRHECDGKVLKVGPSVTDVHVGETAMFHDGGLRQIAQDRYLIHRRFIYATY